MKAWNGIILTVLILTCGTSTGFARDSHSPSAHAGPGAGGRTHAQNYKDMVLAYCITQAYKDSNDVAKDAGSSFSALQDWTEYDLEKAPEAMKTLVDKYLARDYFNPLAESEVKGIRFDLLKCLDLYHSKELDAQVKQMVIQPKRTYRQSYRLREKSRRSRLG